MEPRQEVLKLGHGLQRLLETYSTSAREVSEALGFHPGQLTRVLNGRRPMRVRLVWEVLEHLGASPVSFFKLLYPLGGAAQLALPVDPKAVTDLPGTVPLAEAVRRYRLAQGWERTPKQTVEKLGRLLREVLQGARVSQRAASRGIGLAPDALGQALRGGSELTFLHLFGVLAAAGRAPAGLFLELLSPDFEDPMARLEQKQGIAALEQLLAVTSEALVRGEEVAPAAAGPTESQPGRRAKAKGPAQTGAGNGKPKGGKRRKRPRA